MFRSSVLPRLVHGGSRRFMSDAPVHHHLSPSITIYYMVAEVYGSSAMKRARLIAWATRACCWAVRLVRLRE